MLLGIPIDGLLLSAWGIMSIVSGIRNGKAMFMIVPVSRGTGKYSNRIINLTGGFVFLMAGIILLFRKH
jgi:hypothetical protein